LPSIRTVSPFLYVFCLEHTTNVLHKPIKRIFKVANGLFGLTILHRLLDAVLDMMLQDDFPNLIERSADSRNLRQHVIALAAFFPQPLQTVGMTGDAREPFSDVLA
jgi:hypothetical protein